jgi:putative phosphoesterase
MTSQSLRLLLVSDSHHDIHGLSAAMKKFSGKVDMLIHLGDGVEDIGRAARAAGIEIPRYEAVRGNLDADYALPTRLTLELNGRLAFVAHGHLESAHSGIEGVLASARAVGADLALFGHTHMPFLEEYRGLLLVNPGSVSRPRGHSSRGFAVLEVPEDPGSRCDARFYAIDADGRVREVEAAAG